MCPDLLQTIWSPGAYRIELGKPPSFCLSQQKEPFTWPLCFLSWIYRLDEKVRKWEEMIRMPSILKGWGRIRNSVLVGWSQLKSFLAYLQIWWNKESFSGKPNPALLQRYPLIHSRLTLPEFQRAKSHLHRCCVSHPQEKQEQFWLTRANHKIHRSCWRWTRFVREQSASWHTGVWMEQGACLGDDVVKVLCCPPGSSPGSTRAVLH